MKDQYDEKAEELLPCRHTLDANSAYSIFDIEQCYACKHRPAVAAALREQARRIDALEEALEYAEQVCRDPKIKPYFHDDSVFRADIIPYMMRDHLADAIKERRTALEGK